MADCEDAFCNCGLDGRELQIFIDQKFPNLACEEERCSPYSPGPIENSESVGFLLVDPIHYDEQRDTIVPEAFQELTNRDLSVFRVRHATKSQVNSIRDQLISKSRGERSITELCEVAVSSVRQEVDGERMLALYDTALEEIPSHASVFTRANVLSDRRGRKKVRFLVHSIFSNRRVNYSDFMTTLPV